ncbi:MAG: Spx/MgsR family RNA polymerase-binding regulatory protein [Candidatus Manganitrophus sp. SA1]|nr:Spx/MgsR family RNA polymerase-binding regulatory protein [Candidatus Manganitrophus morganii]
MLTFYHYAKCSTCIKAKKHLTAQGHLLKEIDLTTDPPSAKELADLIKKSGRPYTDFLNRSGVLYREMNMKEKVQQLSEGEIVRMLASNGRLIKRPIVTDGKRVTVGFDGREFDAVWSSASVK